MQTAVEDEKTERKKLETTVEAEKTERKNLEKGLSLCLERIAQLEVRLANEQAKVTSSSAENAGARISSSQLAGLPKNGQS